MIRRPKHILLSFSFRFQVSELHLELEGNVLEEGRKEKETFSIGFFPGILVSQTQSSLILLPFQAWNDGDEFFEPFHGINCSFSSLQHFPFLFFSLFILLLFLLKASLIKVQVAILTHS